MDPLSFETRVPETAPEKDEEQKQRQRLSLENIKPAVITPQVRSAVSESTNVAPTGVIGDDALLDTLQQAGEEEEEVDPVLSTLLPAEEDEAEKRLLSTFGEEGISSISLGEDDPVTSAFIQRIEDERRKTEANETTWGKSLSGGFSGIASSAANVLRGVSERNYDLANDITKHAQYNIDYANGNYLLDALLTTYGMTRNVEAFSREQLAVGLDFMSKYAKDLADHYYTKPTQAPLLSPDGLTDLVFRNLPQLGVGVVTTALNPAAGAAFFTAMHAGEAYGNIAEYERVTGIKVPEEEATKIAFGVAAVNSSFERLGVNAVLGTTSRNLTQTMLKKIATASMTEGLTEGGQTATQLVGQLMYNDYYTVSENALQQIGQAMLGGALLGGMVGGVAAGANAASRRSNVADVTLSGFELTGDFYMPTFEVTREGHPLEGRTLTLDEASKEGLVLPDFRLKLLKHQIKQSADKMTNREVDMIGMFMQVMSGIVNMDTEQFLDTMKFNFTNRQAMSPTDLMQYIGRPSDSEITDTDYAKLVTAQNIVRNADAVGESRDQAIRRAQIATGWLLRPSGKWAKQIEPIKLKAQAFFDFMSGKSTPAEFTPIDPQLETALLKLDPGNVFKYQVKLGDLLEADSELFTYFPDFKDKVVVFNENQNTSSYGAYYPSLDVFELSFPAYDRFYADANYNNRLVTRIRDRVASGEDISSTLSDPNLSKFFTDVGSTFAHEIQHMLARRSGDALEQGGNSFSFIGEGAFDPLFDASNPGVSARYREAIAKNDMMARATIAMEYHAWLQTYVQQTYGGTGNMEMGQYGTDFYRRLLGEVEARTAQQLFRHTFMKQLQLANIPITPALSAEIARVEKEMAEQTMTKEEILNADSVTISNVVKRFPDQLSEAEKSLQSIASGNVKGAMSIAENGEIIAKMFNGSNMYTVMHELAHMFRFVLPEKMQRDLAHMYGVPTRFAKPGIQWEPTMEEAFAKDFLSYLAYQADNTTRNPNLDSRLVPFFSKFAETLEESVLAMMGDPALVSKELIKIDPTVEQVFSQIFTWKFENSNPLDLPKKKGKLFDKIYKHLSISKYAERLGIPETGLAIRDMFNIWNSSIGDGSLLVEKVSKLLKGDEALMTKAFLSSEDGNYVDQIIERQKRRSAAIKKLGTISPDEIVEQSMDERNYESAVLLIREYFDSAEQELIRAGAFEVGFVDRIISELQFQISNKQGMDPKETADLIAQLQKAIDTKFIHISLEGLLEGLAQTNKSAYKRALTLLSSKKRATVRFQDLLEGDDPVFNESDVNFSDIIRHYANRKGRDLAVLNLRNVAELEGAIMSFDGANVVNNYVLPKAIPFIKDKQMHPFVMQAYDQLLEPLETGNIILTYLRHTKMGQFFNPFIMPMYNVVQMNQVGVNFITDPEGSKKAIMDAYNDVVNRTPRFLEYERLGLSSQPDVLLRSQQEREYARAVFLGKNVHLGKVARPVTWVKEYLQYVRKGTSDSRNRKREAPVTAEEQALAHAINFVEQGGRGVLGMYNSLSDMAWIGDTISRVVTARYLQDVKGMTAKQAVQEASRATGMYSDIPRNTRRVLNLLFFTPSFKIAMANFFLSSLRSMSLILDKDSRNMYHKEKAMVVTRTLGIFFAYDFLMTAVLGFEREELGRRYFKRVETVDTINRYPRGTKEVVLSWSSPHNLFSKYLDKLNTVMYRPETINRPAAFMSQFGYEFHPAYTIMANVIANKRSVSNESIYNFFDSETEQALRIGRYVVGNTYGIFRAALDQDLDPRGRELVVENYNNSIAFITGLVAFPYERDVYEQRVAAQYLALVSTFQRDAGVQISVQRFLSGELTKQEHQEMLDKIGPRTKEFLARLDQLMEELSLHYYPQAPDFYETPDITEMKQNYLGFDRFRKTPREPLPAQEAGETAPMDTYEDVTEDDLLQTFGQEEEYQPE